MSSYSKPLITIVGALSKQRRSVACKAGAIVCAT
jgi:hypothetical protein